MSDFGVIISCKELNVEPIVEQFGDVEKKFVELTKSTGLDKLMEEDYTLAGDDEETFFVISNGYIDDDYDEIIENMKKDILPLAMEIAKELNNRFSKTYEFEARIEDW